jgi:hypothetical protein
MAPPPNVPPPAPSPPRTSLSGGWGYGFDPEPEPTAGPLQGCRQTLRIIQTGDALTMENDALCGLPSEEATGARDGNRLHLEGSAYRGNTRTPLAIALTYDPMNDHLRGTWNGRGVWLVPASPCPSVASLCSVALEGTLYDAAGAPFTSPGQVHVVSTNPSNPFDSTVDSVEGHYLFHGVPTGIALRVTVTSPGHEEVTRLVTPLRGPSWTLNFGGPATEADPDAPAFAIGGATNVTQGL